VIETIRQGLKEDGFTVSISKLCRWFGVPRRTVYYRPTRKSPRIQERFSVPIKQMIEENPSFGYRTVAHLLGFNKNTVQRIFQLMGWQVRTRASGLSVLECELCPRSLRCRMNVGRQIYVACGHRFER
jgi:putative transposase